MQIHTTVVSSEQPLFISAVVTGGFTKHHVSATSFHELSHELGSVDWFFVREVYVTVVDNGTIYLYNGERGLINGNGPHLDLIRKICKK